MKTRFRTEKDLLDYYERRFTHFQKLPYLIPFIIGVLTIMALIVNVIVTYGLYGGADIVISSFLILVIGAILAIALIILVDILIAPAVLNTVYIKRIYLATKKETTLEESFNEENENK